MVQNAADKSESVDNHFREVAASRLSIANNVITKRREQLKEWEDSEMNKLAPVRRSIDRSKVKFQDSDVFLSACVSGDEEEVDDLLDKGANINTTTIDGVTALHQAVIDGKIETISFLLDRGADINAQDNEGWTPLHAAVCCGSLPIVQLLCQMNADLTFVNSDKELAIDLAEDDEIKQYLDDELRTNNINVDDCKHREFNMMMKDCTEWIRSGKYSDKPHEKTGATALHVAASKGYNQLIGMLIRAGANVHAKDFEGWTPLHAAAHWGEKDACRILMENGAKLSEKNFADQDVLRVADKSIVDYLEDLAKKPLKIQTKPSYVQISQSASHVLQPTTNVSMAYKRASVPRLSTGEKSLLSKKDEQDENVSLVLGVDIPTTRASGNISPAPPSPVALTTLAKDGSPERSVSPPPFKKPTPIDAEGPKIIFRNYQPSRNDSGSSVSSQRSTPSVTAVLPAPRTNSQDSSTGSSKSGSVSANSSSSSVSSVAKMSTSIPASPSMTAAILATQKPPPGPILRGQKVIEIPTTSSPQKKAPISQEEDLEDEDLDDVNTQSGISSIRDSSRSMSARDGSSNLYSSDQSVECVVKIPSTVNDRATSSSASSSTPKPAYWTQSFGMDPSKKLYHVASSSSTSAVAPRISSPASSENNSPLASPTVHLRKPSFQTPPTAPVPQKESEAERKAKSRLQRASRRSTQGVTAEQLSEIRAASEDIGKWKSSTLQQTAIQNSAVTNSKRSDEDEGQYLTVKPITAVSTPSANKFRRSQIVRGNRRGTGPVDHEALSAANEVLSDQQTEVNDGNKKFANVTVRRREDNTPRTFTTPSKLYQESQQTPLSIIHGPVVANPPRTGGVASISVNGSLQNGAGSDKYKLLYEKEKEENERLRRRLDAANNRSGDTSNGTSRSNSAMDDHEKRTMERKIAELEYELEKAKQLQSDYKRLKDENGALIRVISKLSTK